MQEQDINIIRPEPAQALLDTVHHALLGKIKHIHPVTPGLRRQNEAVARNLRDGLAKHVLRLG
ncbi:hypothetical protein D3C73_1674130 [compost metagenome]